VRSFYSWTEARDDLAVPLIVQLLAAALDVLIRLSAERRGDHPPRAPPRELVQRERDLLVLPDR
jgi:hypothetical protein